MACRILQLLEAPRMQLQQQATELPVMRYGIKTGRVLVTGPQRTSLVGLFVETERKMREDSSKDSNPRNNYLVPYSLRLDKGDMSR